MAKSFQSKMFDGVTILTDDDQEFTLSHAQYRGGGRAGEVFQLNRQLAVKVYYEPVDSRDHERLKFLCRQRATFPDCVVAPMQLVRFKDKPNQPAGFVMKYLPEAKHINAWSWIPTIPPEKVDDHDRTLASFLYDISDGLTDLHANDHRVVMGDLKPENILVSNNRAYLVDFDSCSLPDFPSRYFTIQYVDPVLREGVPNAGGPFEFTKRSDWWALAVIAFELFIGTSPWLGGVHRGIRKDKLANRSFQGAAVLLDENVRPDRSCTRPLEWLDGKERLKAYFNGTLRTRNLAKRVPIDGALESCFPRKDLSTADFYCPTPVAENELTKRIDEIIRPAIEDVAHLKALEREKKRMRMLDMLLDRGTGVRK